MTTQELDTTKVEEFAERLIGLLNSGSLALVTSIGHQTGLFDAMSGLPPSTSEQIAAAAGLNERYVREWLAAMVVGRIVEHDHTAAAYALPPEHAASLTRAAGTNNIAQFTQYIALLGGVEQEIVECFRRGGGVPYSAFGRFQQVMAEESGAVFDATLLGTTLPLVPRLPERLQAGIDVLDVGCGSGHAINLIGRAFPHSRLTGYDISAEGIAAARAEAKQLGLTNVRFEVKDVTMLEEPERYDLITVFDAIHDQAQPGKVLKAIATALRPDGTFLMVDIAASSVLAENLEHPLAPFLYTASTMHCMTVSLARDGEGLGTMWGEQKACGLLTEAGFTQVELRRVDGDIQNNYYIATRR